MKSSSKLYMGIAAMAISLNAQAYPGESIVRDPSTGNYTITYVGSSDTTQLSQTIFVPATKIEPTIRSSFRLGEEGIITYCYIVSNGIAAKQAIVDVVLQQIVNPISGEPTIPADPVTRVAIDTYATAIKAATVSPPNWDGNIVRRLSQIDWSPNATSFNAGGIHPGSALSGFGFNSRDLPGVGSSWMAGRIEASEIFGFSDDGPVKDSAILAQLNQLRDKDYVTRNVAVPTIAVPIPFDPAMTLERIQMQMHTWISKQLLDAAFSAQLDRSFESAISAYHLNQPGVGKQEIQTMRELINKEQPDLGSDEEHESEKNHEKSDDRKSALIDRLAARVLDFDLEYVTKRISRDKDDDKAGH
jgi:hypothetical protein